MENKKDDKPVLCNGNCWSCMYSEVYRDEILRCLAGKERQVQDMSEPKFENDMLFADYSFSIQDIWQYCRKYYREDMEINEVIDLYTTEDSAPYIIGLNGDRLYIRSGSVNEYLYRCRVFYTQLKYDDNIARYCSDRMSEIDVMVDKYHRDLECYINTGYDVLRLACEHVRDVMKIIDDTDFIQIFAIKNHFYESLGNFEKIVYKTLQQKDECHILDIKLADRAPIKNCVFDR